MGDDQQSISVAEYSDGPPTGAQPDRSVDLPVVEILTGRGFITGKSGSGKSNTASVVAEKLLDSGFGLLIVDIDGEYYGLKEEYEILHVGADEECDIQITVEHAGKIASLALEENVPIILDVSSFLDEDEAEELLTEVSKQLFAKAKKLKQPFLMLVEEVHEYIPENGSVGECGKMLIKIGKRGRKHGLGMVGISQRPADVKKDFITQCDWRVWHRLTWNNDTKVVSRILDSDYADAVEDLDDGEAFVRTDWAETVHRVQFHRKRTFDAGATPGLEDVDRPDLKSVSSDLVSELESISDDKERTEDRIAELREELDRKNSRIAELEAELQDARDLSRMADQFVDALLDTVAGVNPGRTEQEKMRERRQRRNGDGTTAPSDQPESAPADGKQGSVFDAGDPVTNADGPSATESPGESDMPAQPEEREAGRVEATGSDDGGVQTATASSVAIPNPDLDEAPGDPEVAGEAGTQPEPASDTEAESTGTASDEVTSETVAAAPMPEMGGAVFGDDAATAASETTEGADRSNGTGSEQSDDADVAAALDELGVDPAETARDATDPELAGLSEPERELVEDLRSSIEAMPAMTRDMLAHYREEGPLKPNDAHAGAGGVEDDRTTAYAHNRTLRTQGFIEHVGRGHYDARVGELVAEQFSGRLATGQRSKLVDTVAGAL